MEKETKIVEISKHSAFKQAEYSAKKFSKTTNPIAKSFVHFFLSKKDKFSIKDILK